MKKSGVIKDWRKSCSLSTTDDPHILCHACKNSIFNGKIRKLALFNGLKLPEVPSDLNNLLPLEERFISPRLPFMQIRELGIDTQYELKGDCINVPINVDNNILVLPRTRDELQAI